MKRTTTPREERQALDSAVAAIVYSWADIEGQLAVLLGTILAERDIRLHTIATDMFFGLVSAEARISIVDAAFRARLKQIPEGYVVKQAWDKLHNGILKQKRNRNTVAHSTALWYTRKGTSELRMGPSMFDRRSRQPSQGMTTKELREVAASMLRHARKISKFDALIIEWNSGNSEAFSRILRELAG